MTTTISAILVDDEIDNREVLRKLLNTYFPKIKVTGEASNVEEAYTLIQVLAPRLVFLDIQMPRANGFNLLKRFETVPFEVIFVTSYDQYAINAIKFNALDYILKPVDVEDLEKAIQRAVKKIENKTENALQIINLLYTLNENNHEKRIAIHAGDKVKILHASEILYIEADGRYCKLFMTNGKHYTTAKVLKDFEDYLGIASTFIRISKSLLLNSFYIKEYSKGDPFIITMVNNIDFEIPRRKKAGILEKLNSGK